MHQLQNVYATQEEEKENNFKSKTTQICLLYSTPHKLIVL